MGLKKDAGGNRLPSPGSGAVRAGHLDISMRRSGLSCCQDNFWASRTVNGNGQPRGHRATQQRQKFDRETIDEAEGPGRTSSGRQEGEWGDRYRR